MDDGSQKLLDVIDDPSALESFLGLSAAAAGESSSRTTLESLVDSLQQGLLDPSTTTSGGGTSARHVPTGAPHTAHAGSVVLTQHQLQQLQQFQAGNATGRPHGQSVAFTLPPHSNTSPVVSSSSSSSSAATVVCSSSCIPVSTHHFVLTPLHHTGGGSTTHPHPSSHPITLINSSGQQPGGTLVSTSVSQPSTSFIYTPATSASPSFSTSGSIPTTGLQLGNPNVTIGHGGTILATPTAGLHLGATVPPAGMPVIGSTVGNTSIQSLTSNSTPGGSLFGASIIPAANASANSGVLVGPSGTTVFTPALATNAISSPGSPFSVPTRSPAPHAPPTPSPSPLPLRSPASVPSHHPPSPAPSPYHTQLQSPQQQQQQQQQQGSVANPPYILSTSASQTTPANLLKEPYGSLQPHVVSSSQTPTSFVLSTANATFKDVYNMQQPSSQPPPQPSVVVLPQQRSSLSGSTTNTSPSPAQSPYSNLQSPVSQQNATMLNQHLVQHIGTNSVAPTRSPAPGGAQPAGTITPGGALTPAPSPSPQTRTAASPVIRSTTPQPTVIHQTLPAGLALSGTGQFPVIPPGSTTMLQGNHQLVQIIHHQTAAPPTTTFPSHTQIITTAGPGGTVPIHQSGTTVGGPPKPKQPPQILPKPPSGQPSSGSHAKLAANSRSTSTQHQGLHTQHHTTAPAAQVVIGQANHSTVIPTAQAGTLLLNPVIPGLGAGGPVLVQPNPSGGVQLILRSPTPGTQATSPAQSSQQNQQQQGKSPTSHQQSMFISGAATAQLIQSTGRQQMQQVLRLFTSQGPMQLQQIQTPSGPTFIAVPSSQTLSFQQLGPQGPPPPAVPSQQPQIPPQPSSGTRSSAPQQPSSGSQQPATPIIPTVQLHQGNMRPSPNVGVPTSRTGCTPQQSVSAVIGGHTIALNANSSTTSSIIHQNHPQVQPPVSGVVPQSQQDVTPSQQNVTFPIMRHNTPVLQTQQHQCTGTNTETSILALSQKRKTKKKKKKKKDEEPKLDLANIMKLSGIGDDEDLALYDAEEPTIAPTSQSPAPSEINTQQSPVSQTQAAQQQSQLIAQLRSPPQIPLQNATGGTASLRLALEDGHVVLHHTPSDSQQSAANILLQNFPSTVGQQQQQHNVSTAQNQLSALLASGSCSNAPSAGGASNHVVLSQLLQQTSPSGQSPHLISASTNTSTSRGTNSTSPNPLPSTAANTLQPHSQERFSMLQQQGIKSGFLKDAFSSAEIANSGISQITTSIAGNLDGTLANAVPGTFGIQAKSPAGTVGCANFRDGFIHPGSNKVDSSTSTCPKTSPMSSPGLVLSSHENTTSLLLAKPPHQHTCHQEVTLKPPQDTIQKQSSATTQTELIHPSIHLGPKQHEPVPFISASKTGADAGPTFLGLHPFSNIQGLVSTTGGSLPLVTAPVMTSGSGNFGGEQLLIAHHAGMSVLAAPQLIQCLQQTQNAAAPGIINMPQLHLTQSAINKAIGQGLAFNTPTGTILIGGSPETFSAAVTNQHKPSIVTANNNTATKLLPQQPSVLLQQLNTGTANAVRRCSSDSNNSSISIGSPPPGGGGAASGTTAVIGLINQPMVSQSTSATSASTGTRKNQQSIETQTISLGIPTTNSLQTTFLDNIVHTHPNLVRLVQPTTTSVHTGKKKKQKQPRMSKILPGVTPANIIVNRQCNSTGTTTDLVKSPLQERNFSKPTTVCQGTQHVTRTTGNDASFYVTAPPFTLAQQSVRVSTVSCNTSNTNSVPPLTSICSVMQNTPTNILCQVGSTATSTATTMATLQSVMSKVAANLGVQTVAADVATTSSGHHHLTPSTSKPGMQHHCVASQTVSVQQPQSGMVPHLVPIPAGGNTVSSTAAQATAVGMQSIIQKVQTIQLTPQNQKHLKAVQMQIQSVTSKRVLTSTDQAALHRLYDEQQRILLTGKVVPTIPGQHAVGLPLNPDVIPSTVDGKLKSQAEVELNTANTHLANLLRQQLVVPHQTTQMPVRYQHQVGNQIIPLTPANLQQKPAPSSSVATTTTTASTVTTRASISVQCGTHLSPSDALIQQPVGLAAQSLPKLSVVQPMLQATGTTSVSSSQQSKSTGQPSSCEKGTSPLQVQVGTQTTLPCIESSSSSSSCSPHLSMATSVCSGKLSPAVVSSAPCNSSTSKLSPVPGQQLFSPGKVQPVFVASATNAKVQQSFSPTGSNKSCQPSVLGCKVLTSGGKPQAVVAPVSPSGSASSRSSPAMASVPSGTPATVVVGGMPVTGSGKRPTATTSPIRPNFSRSDLIEQQLKTDQGGACMPDTCTPFQSTSDACKRLIRYHVFNEQLLSQQDLEKADEFFEATAKHLLDKFRQMMNKYRYLLLMESMREVNTSELMMIDRMFVAEEHGLLERLKEEERRAKEEPVAPAEQQPSSPPPAGVLTTIKTEPGLPASGGTTTGEGLREVRVVVRDVMKNESIKRELEEDRKFTVVKRERLDSPASNKVLHQAYDEWEEIQKELAVYCGSNNITASGSTGNPTLTPAIKVEEVPKAPEQLSDERLCLSTAVSVKAESDSISLDLKLVEAEGKVQPHGDNIDDIQKLPSAGSPGTKARSGACGPRDEGGGTQEEVNMTQCSEDSVGEKRKEFCDTNIDGMASVGHRKKRHKHGYSPQQNECVDDKDDDINAQVQSAIDSILNLKRSDDGFDIRPNATTPSHIGVDEGLDCEDTRQYLTTERTESATSSSKQCSTSASEIIRTRHKRNSVSCKPVDQQVVNHHEDSSSVDNTDSALDEAVRSILTS